MKKLIIVSYIAKDEGVILETNILGKLKNGNLNGKQVFISWDKICQLLFEDYTELTDVASLNSLKNNYLLSEKANQTKAMNEEKLTELLEDKIAARVTAKAAAAKAIAASDVVYGTAKAAFTAYTDAKAASDKAYVAAKAAYTESYADVAKADASDAAFTIYAAAKDDASDAFTAFADAAYDAFTADAKAIAAYDVAYNTVYEDAIAESAIAESAYEAALKNHT